MSSSTAIFACLVILLPFLSSVLSEPCNLAGLSQQLSPECVCSGFNLTCTGRWPRLEDLQQGDIPSSLQALTVTQTEHVTLDSCRSTFQTLRSLRTLNLSGNQISTTRSMSFASECFPNLVELILDDNALRLTAKQTFSGLVNLQKLSLRYALVRNQSVSANLTQTLTKSHLPSLKELILDDNLLGSLAVSTFNFANMSSTNVSKIRLRNCSLGAILPGTFDSASLRSLSYLDLSMNKMTALMKENLDSLNRFPALTVNLTGNPFTCNCELRDFWTWLNALNITTVTVVDPGKLVCSPHSFSHVGRPVLEVKSPQELNCTEVPIINQDDMMRPSYYLLIAVLGLIGLLALIVLFMRRKEIIKFCNQIKQATKETFDTHHTSYVYSDITRATRDTPEHSAVDV